MKSRIQTHLAAKKLLLALLCVVSVGAGSLAILPLPAFAKKQGHAARSTDTNYANQWSKMSYDEKQSTIIDALFAAVPDPAVATMLDGPSSDRILKYFDKAYSIKENASVPFKEVAAFYISRTIRSTRE